MQVLFEGIYNKISGSALSTSLGGRFYLGVPQKSDFPYARYGLISNVQMREFNDSVGEEYAIQFDLFSNSKHSTTEVCTLYDNLVALYDECDLTVTGYTFMRMFRENSYLIRDVANSVWQYSVEYTIWVWKN